MKYLHSTSLTTYPMRKIFIGIMACMTWVPIMGIQAQTVTMSGSKTVAPLRHDGALRPVVGVQEHALFRPSRSTAKLQIL
jgi:hypothetical protein